MNSRALIVDDHPIVRDALESSLVSLNVFNEIDFATSFSELTTQLAQDSGYQLLILDLSLTDVSGSDGMIFIRENYPELPVIVFSASDSNDIITRCFEHGVHGFVSKNESMQIFVSAIRTVLAGGIYIPPSLVGLSNASAESVANSDQQPVADQYHLTPKQREVFTQLLDGVPNKIIGKRLNLAEGTVKAHLHSIYRSLGVNNRAQAIVKAQRLKLDL